MRGRERWKGGRRNGLGRMREREGERERERGLRNSLMHPASKLAAKQPDLPSKNVMLEYNTDRQENHRYRGK